MEEERIMDDTINIMLKQQKQEECSERKESPLRISHGRGGSDSLVRPWGSLTVGSPLPHPHASSYICVQFKRLLSVVGRILMWPPRPLALLFTHLC